jgi:membrane associated rhomboid family serine protease
LRFRPQRIDSIVALRMPTPISPPSTFRERHPFFDNAILLFAFVVVFWVIELVDLIPGLDLDDHGVIPRERAGLLGIFTAPFLHGNFPHLIGNTLPFLVLGGLVMLGGRKGFVVVTFISALVAGAGIWLFAASRTNHIGASTLIFGYLGFLLLAAWFSRDWKRALLAIAAGFLYGGLVIALFKFTRGVSWHGHAFGFLGGALAAWLLAGDKGRKPRKAPIAL